MAIEEVGGSGHGEVRMEREATRGGSQRSRRPGGSSGADGATTRARIGRGVARKTRLCGGTPNFVMLLLLLQPFITMPSRASSPHGVRPAGQGHPSIAPHVAPSPPGSKRPSYLSCLPWLVNLFQSLAFTPFSSAFSSANGLEHDANHQERRSRASEPFIPPWEDFEVPVQPLDSDMVVPDWRHESPKDAVESSTKSGARIYCRQGDHHWDGKITIRGSTRPNKGPRETQIIGEGESRLWGRWSMSRHSKGSFKGVMCAYETEGVGWPCVIIRGDPWLFDTCQIRSAGAYAVMCAKQSRATLRRCGVGGMGSGARKAINAVIVMDSSWCLLQSCAIEDTDYAHPGVRLMENAAGGIEKCTLQRNGYAVAVDNNAKVYLRDCVLRDNDHAAFYAGWEAAMAVMEIHRCTVFGKVWQTADRPGKLSEGDNRMVSSVTDNYFNPDSETAESLYSDVHQTPLDMPIPATPQRNPSPEKMPTAAPIDPKPPSPQPKPYNIQRKRSVPDLRAEMFALSSDAYPVSSPPSRPSPPPPTSGQPAPGRTLSPFRTESTFPSPSPHSEGLLQTPAPVSGGKGPQPQSSDADGGMSPSRIDGLQSQSNAHVAPTEGYDVGHSPAPPSRSASPNGGDHPETETLSSLQARQSLAEPPASPPPNPNETRD